VLLQAMFDGPPPLSAYPANLRSQIEAQQQRIKERVAPGSSTSGRA
jgi:penicillin-binding protein 2